MIDYQIKLMFLKGVSPKNISKELGIPFHEMFKKFKDMGLELPEKKLPEKARIVFKNPLETLPNDSCLFPYGDLRNGDLKFCKNKRVAGKSYCADCHAKAYRKPKNIKPISVN